MIAAVTDLEVKKDQPDGAPHTLARDGTDLASSDRATPRKTGPPWATSGHGRGFRRPLMDGPPAVGEGMRGDDVDVPDEPRLGLMAGLSSFI